MTTKVWTGSGTSSLPESGNWGTSTNWSSPGVPAGGDEVVVVGSGTSTQLILDTNSAELKSLTTNNAGAITVAQTVSISSPGGLTNEATQSISGAVTATEATPRTTVKSTITTARRSSSNTTINVARAKTGCKILLDRAALGDAVGIVIGSGELLTRTGTVAAPFLATASCWKVAIPWI